MGHMQGGRRAPLGELIAYERRRQSLTRAELAAMVRRVDRTLRTDESQVKRWEGGQEPQPAALRALALVMGLPIDELARLVHQADQLHDGSLTIDTYRLVGGALDWRSLIPNLQQAADRLCRLYATRRPAELIPRVQERARLVQDLLHDGAGQHRRDLAETGGWLYLLLAALHGGLGQLEAAWTSQCQGLLLGLDQEHGDLVGWAYETAGWLSQLDGLWTDVLDAGEEGVRRSPPRSSARVQSLFKVAHASAALGDRLAAERALDGAADVVAGMDQTERPEHHFVFDAPKFDKFAANVYATMGTPAKTAEHARIVIARSDDPGNPARFHPMRAMGARADLASALLEMGELDEACSLAAAGLRGPFTTYEVVGQVGGLLARMQERYAKEPAVAALADGRREALAALAAS